jgi:DNA polymerase-3 subunit alpha
LVATNPCSFADESFHEAHDAMLCIANSSYIASDDRPRSSPDAWMKPANEMKSLFADLPEAIANTLVVAQRCAFAAPKRKPILPSLAGDREGEAAMLRDSSGRSGETPRQGRDHRRRKLAQPISTGSSSSSTSSSRWAFPAIS